jgi:hypothetical protein
MIRGPAAPPALSDNNIIINSPSVSALPSSFPESNLNENNHNQGRVNVGRSFASLSMDDDAGDGPMESLAPSMGDLSVNTDWADSVGGPAGPGGIGETSHVMVDVGQSSSTMFEVFLNHA